MLIDRVRAALSHVPRLAERKMFRGTKSVFLALVAITSVTTRAASQSSDWRWFQPCQRSRTMLLEVRLDTTQLFRSTFLICRVSRDIQSTKRHITFKFTSARALVWRGYRNDAGETTGAGREFDVDIWEAGADSIGPILGVVAISGGTIFMNTLHIAAASKRASTELADGLILRTYPAKSGPR